MKFLCVLIAGLMLFSVTPMAMEPFVQRPPVKFQGDTTARVHFVVDATKTCSVDAPRPAPGMIIVACTDLQTKEIIMPNPCAWVDNYAQLMCHEMAHVNSWRHE